MIINLLIGIAVLSAIILIHELGHFITAKAGGVKVEEFGLGFPPRLLSLKRGETRYSLNAIPFGGFVKMAGEEDPEVPGSLAGKKRGTRLLIISAGSLMNLLLALLLFSTSYLFPRASETGRVEVLMVAPESPAAAAGIEAGDIILSVNNQSVDSHDKLNRYITDNLGKEITLLVQHPDSAPREVRLIPRPQPPENEGAIGIAIRTVRLYPLWQAIPRGAAELVNTVIMWGAGLASIFTGEASGSLIGPVGLVQLTGEVAGFGLLPLLRIAAMISLILGIMNLLPLPAIDGGRIAFLFLEWVRRGKRISPRAEAMVHLIGLALFLLLFLAITYQDIIRIINRETLIP
ncbi:MAG: M50 family metallopeptidase [Dehalococcoidales bacterium]|nr:M50 family metallopeptidase [Dehalococcoidales bacterium]